MRNLPDLTESTGQFK